VGTSLPQSDAEADFRLVDCSCWYPVLYLLCCAAVWLLWWFACICGTEPGLLMALFVAELEVEEDALSDDLLLLELLLKTEVDLLSEDLRLAIEKELSRIPGMMMDVFVVLCLGSQANFKSDTVL
jgi:hypothetical protein